MGQKINPIGLRLGVNRTADSRWYADSADFGRLLHEDIKIRKYIKDKLKQAGVSRAPGQRRNLAYPALIVAILVVGTTAFHVRVDQDGLTVRSILGVPRFRIPLADIAEVRLASVTSIGATPSCGASVAMKCSTRSGMSSLCERSGGSVISTTCSR